MEKRRNKKEEMISRSSGVRGGLSYIWLEWPFAFKFSFLCIFGVVIRQYFPEFASTSYSW